MWQGLWGIKEVFGQSSNLSRPKKEEILYAYVTVTTYAVSLALVQTKKGVQKPVYYVSKSFQKMETHFLPLENVILVIICAMKKLPHYFQAYTIVFLTQLPLQALLRKLDFTRRVAKWGTILRAFDIKFLLRIAIKEQVLVNLVAEFTEEAEKGDIEEHGMLIKGVMAIVASPLP